MKFDKTKILTVVTADQAKVGMKGWVAVLPQYIQEIMSDGREPSVLSNIDLDSPSPFTMEGRYAWPLFYPVPEPTYTERQAEWIKENNVKAGTKVRVTRTFTEDEDGSCCWEHNDLVGMTGSVDGYGIVPHSLGINMSDGNFRAIPYFALEVIKEPTYRPYNNDELKDLGDVDGIGALRCPFCRQYPSLDYAEEQFRLLCKDENHLIDVGFHATLQQAIDAWNRRT